jgi:hypothetical protein
VEGTVVAGEADNKVLMVQWRLVKRIIKYGGYIDGTVKRKIKVYFNTMVF